MSGTNSYIVDRYAHLIQGMTPERWRYVPVELVAISDLVWTKNHPNPASVQRMLGGNLTAVDEYPWVVEWGGTLYLHDGHSRIFVRRSLGYGDVEVRVLRAGPTRLVEAG